jgi:hypothetical protein
MSHTASNIEERQEFWKPVIPSRPETEHAPDVAADACANCSAQLVADARFCHACGAARSWTPVESAELPAHPWYDLIWLRDALGQTTASLVALIVGSACVIAALFTGIFFTATTLLDWQAVQLWRIEWLLAAVALFVAGILLKKK